VFLSDLPYLQKTNRGVVRGEVLLELRKATLPLFVQSSAPWQDIFHLQERKIDRMQIGVVAQRIDLRADWNEKSIRMVQNLTKYCA
jgi:hypothetical protein